MFPHWWYIRCKIRRVTTRARRAVYADAPCKLSRTVSSGTALYVIRPGTPNSLHGGALPVVVLFDSGARCPYMQPDVAYQCATLYLSLSLTLAERRRGSLSLFSFFPPFSSSILLRHSFSSEKLLASCPRPRLFRLAFFRRAAQLRVETGKRESLRTRKPRYLGLKSILTLRCAISTRGLVVPCSLIPRLVMVSLSLS